jgi:hypothetical protein
MMLCTLEIFEGLSDCHTGGGKLTIVLYGCSSVLCVAVVMSTLLGEGTAYV